MTYSVLDVVSKVAESQPALAEAVAEHQIDNDGEVFPHVLFGDVARWIVRQESEDPESSRAVVLLLDDLYANGDAGVRELLQASFIENLPVSSETFASRPEHLSQSPTARALKRTAG
jgi:hypothetical protein